ncbi:glycosyltransferase family 4 protein [Chitinophaga varians]|uniref:glycosyltransferase family 4 protein n=1 Tax=Chitinophaga varians TaxID=2202339 RepID=UPI00165F94E0|nr:glycosyltransferase family 4 protein [Chitinophaga varians]MBC9908888.1 glycosyltransferase family 4 protein [Chitinophaga varians]
MAKLLVHAWVVHREGGRYYLPYTHWVYLKEIVKYYDEVCLMSPVQKHSGTGAKNLMDIGCFDNVKVYALPYSPNYVRAVPHFPAYLKAYRKLKNYDEVYARYPVPFGWLGKFFFKGKKRIVHFVGDPVDAARTNPNFSRLKKFTMITLFMPEHSAYMWACKGASVFTNGHHLRDKLTGWGIQAKAVISSTLNDADFYAKEINGISEEGPKLLYVGYLRKAKGVETVIRSFQIVQRKYPGSRLTVVGSGEFERELKDLAAVLHLDGHIHFAGHVDNREELNNYLRSHDIFCFASLSEGSPRVILEAMANSLAVVSTPVGSLPNVFEDKEDILFADFNDHEAFYHRVDTLVKDSTLRRQLSDKAYNKVRGFTIEGFIKSIFHEG